MLTPATVRLIEQSLLYPGGFLSPLAIMGIYFVVPPYAFYGGGPWAVGAAILVPMLVVAIVARVFGGMKPPR